MEFAFVAVEEITEMTVKVQRLYSNFSDTGQKAPLPFKSSKHTAWYRVNFQTNAIAFLS